MYFDTDEVRAINWCLRYFAKINNYGKVGEAVVETIDNVILKTDCFKEESIVGNPIKEVTTYEINMTEIRCDSIVKYKKDSEWIRGMVKFVDKNSVKIMRSVGTQESFSATQIGSGNVELAIEIY